MLTVLCVDCVAYRRARPARVDEVKGAVEVGEELLEVERPTASERNLKEFEDFSLRAKARIWPRLSSMLQIRRTECRAGLQSTL